MASTKNFKSLDALQSVVNVVNAEAHCQRKDKGSGRIRRKARYQRVRRVHPPGEAVL